MQTILFFLLMGGEPDLPLERLWCYRLKAVRNFFILLLIEATSVSYSVANNVSASSLALSFFYSFNL